MKSDRSVKIPLHSLLAVLTSTGQDADFMVSMAIPVFGGMLFKGMTDLVAPALYCAAKGSKLKKSHSQALPA